MFQAEGVHLLRGGADKGNAPCFAAFNKIGVFTKKTVAGVHRIHAMLLHQCEQGILIQVGIPGVAIAQAVTFIRLGDVQGVPVGFGENGHGGNAHFFQGTDNTGGNGAAVGNQHFVEHVSVS